MNNTRPWSLVDFFKVQNYMFSWVHLLLFNVFSPSVFSQVTADGLDQGSGLLNKLLDLVDK